MECIFIMNYTKFLLKDLISLKYVHNQIQYVTHWIQGDRM